ncbi:hypothetical protein G9A89_012133 [Geosiphon pyriformis]|nr:hypothetical protein G9A89_012133 [Geosiphon pyriformis]
MPPTTTSSSQKSSRPQVTLHGGNRANFLSSWLFLWVFGLLKLSRRHNLSNDNLSLQESEKAGVVGDKLEKTWLGECKESHPSIRRALIRTFGFSYSLLGFYKLIWAVLNFIGSYYLLNELIKYVEKYDAGQKPTEFSGHMYALGLFLTAFFSSIAINQLVAECTRFGVQVRAALMVLVYRKSLKISSVRGNTAVGVWNID